MGWLLAMLPWAALLGTLGLNFWQHKHGRPTICATTRRFLPKPIACVLLFVGFVALVAHVLDGYDVKIDLSDLSD